MSVIDRHWIHPDINWHQKNPDGTFTVLHRKDFWDGIDHWKNILTEHGFAKHGVLAVGLNLCDIRYVTAIIACLELGGKLVIVDKPGTPASVDTVRCRIHAPFDLMIVNPDDVADNLQAVADTYAKQVISADLWFGDNYRAKDTSHKDIFRATDKHEVIVCTSSGTTGVPKPITYQHDFFYDLCERNQQVFEWQEDDRVLHLSNFHHGGASANFFWPTLKHVKNHYFDYGINTHRLKEIIDLIVDQQINQAMFPNQYVLDEFVSTAPILPTALTAHVLGSNRLRWIEHMQKSNIKYVHAHWGFSEQEGPILLNTLTQDSTKDFDTFNFGQPVDDFYELKLIEQGLEVYNHYRGTYVAKDLLTQDTDGNYIFHGRMHGVRIRDQIVDWNTLIDITNNMFDYDQAYIIPDSEYRELYLLIDSSLEHDPSTVKKIEHINQELTKIDPYMYIRYISYKPIIEFYDFSKFSYLLAKIHFRQTFNLS